MQHKVDYISYTYFSQRVADSPNLLLHEAVRAELPSYIDQPDTWKHAPKRLGFQGGLNIDNHTFIFYSHMGLILIEHTGQACNLLEAKGLISHVVTTYAERLTRIDIATDILHTVRPAAFVERSAVKAVSAKGYQKSKTGETVYVGSKKSDRTCKVYRYDGSHPRRDWLRIEYTYRGKQAQIIGETLKTSTIEKIALASAKRYNWKHSAWKTPQIAVDELKAWRPERKQGKTVSWIYSQCIPAIAKLVKMGALDLEEIIAAIREACEGKPDKPTPTQ